MVLTIHSFPNNITVLPFYAILCVLGTCLVLGDRQNTFPPFHIKTGTSMMMLMMMMIIMMMMMSDDDDV